MVLVVFHQFLLPQPKSRSNFAPPTEKSFPRLWLRQCIDANQSVNEFRCCTDDEDDDDDDKYDRSVFIAVDGCRARRRRLDSLYRWTWWWSSAQSPSRPHRLTPTWLPINIHYHHHHHHHHWLILQIPDVTDKPKYTEKWSSSHESSSMVEFSEETKMKS